MKTTCLILTLFLMIFMIGCFAKPGDEISVETGMTEATVAEVWETQPYIVFEEEKYVSKGHGEGELPEGYVCVGTMTAEGARYNEHAIDCKVFMSEGMQDLYIYQKCPTLIGNAWSYRELRWAYMHYIPR